MMSESQMSQSQSEIMEMLQSQSQHSEQIKSFLSDSENSGMDTQMSLIGDSQYLHAKLMETKSDGRTDVSSLPTNSDCYEEMELTVTAK